MDHESADERDVDLVEQAYRYLTDKTYPNGATENRKRAIRNKAKRFIIKDGELFYKKKQKEKVKHLYSSFEDGELLPFPLAHFPFQSTVPADCPGTKITMSEDHLSHATFATSGFIETVKIFQT